MQSKFLAGRSEDIRNTHGFVSMSPGKIVVYKGQQMHGVLPSYHFSEYFDVEIKTGVKTRRVCLCRLIPYPP